MDLSLTKVFTKTTVGNIIAFEMFYSSDSIALVDESDPKALVIHWKESDGPTLRKLFNDSIRSVKINLHVIAVCLSRKIHILKSKNLRSLHTIINTAENPEGLLALSIGDMKCLAYPGKQGEVKVVNCTTLQVTQSIKAHSSSLSALAFNYFGTMLATASQGEIGAKVYSIINGCLVWITQAESFYVSNLSFSSCNQFLVCSSNRETLMFKFITGKLLIEHDEVSPSVSSRTINPRALNMKRTSAISINEYSVRFLTATTEGLFHVFSMPNEGGQCPYICTYDLRR